MAVLDKDGYAVDGDGARIKDADGADIQIEGTANQEVVDKVVVALKAEIKTLRKSKSGLEAKGQKVDELEALIARKDEQVRDAESAAAAKASEVTDGLRNENQRLKDDATAKTIKNAILEHAGAFEKPRYLLNELRGTGAIDEDGVANFKVMVEVEGKSVEKMLSAEDAAAHVAKENPALVTGTKDGGSGAGGGFGEGTKKRSEMNRKEKVAFIAAHPGEYDKLPE